MARATLVFWRCNLPCGRRHSPSVRECPDCGTKHYERYANVRTSERAVVDIGPDGSISVPGRSDCPLHPKQIAAGVRREEITSSLAGQYSLKHLEQLGLVHEASNWNSNGDNVPLICEDLPDLTPKPLDQILAEPDAF